MYIFINHISYIFKKKFFYFFVLFLKSGVCGYLCIVHMYIFINHISYLKKNIFFFYFFFLFCFVFEVRGLWVLVYSAHVHIHKSYFIFFKNIFFIFFVLFCF